jgi:predicted nuclease with TOPRIM domain
MKTYIELHEEYHELREEFQQILRENDELDTEICLKLVEIFKRMDEIAPVIGIVYI